MKYFQIAVWSISCTRLHEIHSETKLNAGGHFDRNNISFRVIKLYVNITLKWMRDRTIPIIVVAFELPSRKKSLATKKQNRYLSVFPTEGNNTKLYSFRREFIKDTYRSVRWIWWTWLFCLCSCFDNKLESVTLVV